MMWSAWLMNQGVMKARWDTSCSLSGLYLCDGLTLSHWQKLWWCPWQVWTVPALWLWRCRMRTTTHRSSLNMRYQNTCSSTHTHTWDMINNNFGNKARPNITGHNKWLLDCRLWIRSAGCWSNFPGGELDTLSNLRLIAMAPCYWRSFIQFFVL